MAQSHLYKRMCPSVGSSISQSSHLFVSPSIGPVHLSNAEYLALFSCQLYINLFFFEYVRVQFYHSIIFLNSFIKTVVNTEFHASWYYFMSYLINP